MSMKSSVVVADGTFPINIAPLLGPIEEVARRAAEIGYDAIALTVQNQKRLRWSEFRRHVRNMA